MAKRLTSTEKYNREKIGLFTNAQCEILRNRIHILEHRCIDSKASFLTLDHVLSLLIAPENHDICRRAPTLFSNENFQTTCNFKYEGATIFLDTSEKIAFPPLGARLQQTFYINEESQEATRRIREWLGWANENKRKWRDVRLALNIVRDIPSLQVASFYWSALPSLLRYCGLELLAVTAERPLKNFDRLPALGFAQRKLMAETPGTIAEALLLPEDALRQDVSLRLI